MGERPAPRPSLSPKPTDAAPRVPSSGGAPGPPRPTLGLRAGCMVSRPQVQGQDVSSQPGPSARRAPRALRAPTGTPGLDQPLP